MLPKTIIGSCYSRMVRLRLSFLVSFVGFVIIFQVFRKMNAPQHLVTLQDFDEKENKNRIEATTPESMRDDIVAARFAKRLQVMKSQCPNWRNSKLK